jgi:hypothetical protein
MKTSNPLEFCSPSASTLSFRTLSAGELRSPLVLFFNSLTFDQRRARFGCGMSDDAIVRYCRGLDADESTVIACARVTRSSLWLNCTLSGLLPVAPSWGSQARRPKIAS